MTNEIQHYEEDRSQHINLATHAYQLSKQITNQSTFQIAVDFLLKIKEKRKAWASRIRPAVLSAHKAHKEIKAFEAEIDLPLKKAEEGIMKPAIVRYEQEQERKRAEEQAKLERENKKKMDDAKLKAAVEYEKTGDNASAQAIMNQPTVAVAVELKKETQAKGISYRWRYWVQITDIKVLLNAVNAGKVSMNVVAPNMEYLNQLARMEQENFNIPGVELKKERIVSARGK